jgi:hypothetical protein
MKRLTLQDFKGKTASANATKVVQSLEFIKGGAEEYCHNGNGKDKPPTTGINFSCGNQQ